MLNLADLDKVYDPSTPTIANQAPDQAGPGPKKPLLTLDQVDNKTPPSPITFGAAKPVNVEDYGKLLDNGVYSDQDIDSQRGQHQSIIAKTGHMLGNLPLNIVGSFMEGIGDMGLLAGQYGDDRTYTNALIEAGKSLHNVTGDIYMRNKHETAGQTLSDPSWWIDQVGGLVEFGVSYAALGAGVGGTLSKLAEGTAGLIKAGEAGGRVAQGLGQLGTAGFMSYTMGAANAAQVFQQTYDVQFKKMIDAGLDPEEAKTNATHIAAQSAATTAQVTTAIGTVLALGSMGAYFSRSKDLAMDILKKEVPQQVGEDFSAWAARVKAIDPEKYASVINPSASIGHKLLEMGKMGVEMQQLQFGAKTGEELGREGKVKGFLDQFGELSHYFDRTMDKDGALAFGIGAVSGLGIDFLRNNVIPSRFAEKLDPTTGQPIPKVDSEGNETGKFERKLYTPKALSAMHMATKFTTLRDTIASDIQNFHEMQQGYLAAVKAGDPIATSRAADQMFNVNNVSAITSGMKDVWKQTYDEIGNMSGEEATKRGYTTDPNDTEYQEKAKKASSALDRYQKIYDDLQQRYGTRYDVNAGFKPVVDGLFSRKVHIDSWEENLKEHEDKLFKMSKMQDMNLPITDPELFDQHTADYSRTWDAANKTVDKLKKDRAMIERLMSDFQDPKKQNNARQQMAAIAREYSAIDTDANNSAESVYKSMTGTLERINESVGRQNDRVKQAEDNLLNSSGYTKWLENNEGKTFSEYMKRVNEVVGHDEYQHQIDLSKEKLQIAKRNVADIEKEKNLVRFANKYQKYMEEEYKKAQELERQYNKELALRGKADTTFTAAQKENLNRMANRYREIRDQHYIEYDTANKELNVVNEKLKDAKPEAALALKAKKRELEKKMAGLSTKIEKYDSLYNDIKIPDDVAPDAPIDTTKVTITPPMEVPEESIDPRSAAQEAVNEAIPDLMDLMKTDTAQLAEETEKNVQSVYDTEDKLSLSLSKHLDIQGAVGLMDMAKQVARGEDTIQGFYDTLKKNGLSDSAAHEVILAFSEYQDALQNNPIEAALSLESRLVQEVFDDLSDIEVQRIDIDKPEDPIIYNDFELSNDLAYSITEPQTRLGFAGDKTIDVATAANLTLDYVELAPDKNNEINIANKKDALNEKINPDLFKANKLGQGTKLRFEVATDYDGPKNLTGEFKQDEYGNVPQGRETFADYVDKNGKIPADKMGNAPIRIIDDATGRTVGWVRKHDWVTERYTDGKGKTSKLRNIAEVYDENGDEINAAKQSKKILDMRKAIVDQWNANGGHINGVIKSKGTGHVILNQDYNINTDKKKAIKPGYAKNKTNEGLLPDPNLQIAIVDNGTLKSGKGFQFNKPIAGDTSQLRNGSVMVMIPGANGEFIPAPLVGKSLGESDSAHRTVSRAIELYLQHTGSEEEQATHEVQKLYEKTGHDVSTEKGLRNFINQYFTYAQRFDDSATIPTYKDQRRFLFNVWDKIEGKEGKAWIKAGWTESGQRPTYATLDANGRLSSEFSEILKEGLSTRSKAVVYTRDGLRGINEGIDKNKPFVDAQYRSDGKWQHNTYADYNDYVKSFSKTTVYGKNKLNGQYIYTSNPAISFEMDIKEEVKPTLVEENLSPSKVNLPDKELEAKPYDETLANELDDIFNALPAREPSRVKGIGAGDEKSKPLNLKTLEDLYNFTPEDQRNGLVPSDVLKDLSGRGHTFLSDGYNPFSLCL